MHLVRFFVGGLIAAATVLDYSVVSAAGVTWSPAEAVVELPLSAHSKTGRDVGLAGDGAGTWVASYSTDDIAEVTPSEFVYVVSDDNGLTWEGPRAVLAPDAGEWQGAGAIASDQAGGWLAVWVSKVGIDYSLKAARTQNVNGAWSAVTSPLAGVTSSVISGVALKHNERGGWLVSWVEQDSPTPKMRASYSSNNGTAWSAGATVERAGVEARPSIAHLPTGHWVVAFSGGGSGSDVEGISARLGAAGDLLTTSAINIDSESDTVADYAPSVTWNDGSVVAVWARQAQATWRLLSSRSADGVTWTSETLVSDLTNFVSPAQADPFVASNGSGDLMAVYSTSGGGERDAYYTRSLDGGLTWDVGEVLDLDFGDTTTPQWLRPVVAPVRDGRWLAAWHALPNRSNAGDILGAVPYSAFGIELGAADDDQRTTTDLRLRMSPWPLTSGEAVGNYLGYVLTVENVGALAAHQVVLNVPLGAGGVFKHAVASQGGWSVSTMGGGTNLRAALGTIAAGQRANFGVSVSVPVATTLSYSGNVAFHGLDLNPADNSVGGVVAGSATPPPPPTPPGNVSDPVSWAALTEGKKDKLEGVVLVDTAAAPKGSVVEVWKGDAPGSGKPLKKLKVKSRKGQKLAQAGISVKIKGAKPDSLTAVLKAADGRIIGVATAGVE